MMRRQALSGWCRRTAQYTISPELDEHDVLRSPGRLMNCPWISEDSKRSIIFPRGRRVTTLLLERYHQRFHHLNHQAALNAIRERFQIPRLRAEFDRMRRSCQLCKVRTAIPMPREMGNIPEERLAVHQRAFTFTGVLTFHLSNYARYPS